MGLGLRRRLASSPDEDVELLGELGLVDLEGVGEFEQEGLGGVGWEREGEASGGRAGEAGGGFGAEHLDSVLGGECSEAGNDVGGGGRRHAVILRGVFGWGSGQVRTRINRITADMTKVSWSRGYGQRHFGVL